MWEEFTQSIHTFIEDKKNLAQHTQGKKKATLIVILSVRFTKLIVYYLQSKHKFHPRPGSPLHLPNEEHVLGYLKFSAKGTKREVFGMPIPNDLITDDIRGEQYYNDYLEKVAMLQSNLMMKKKRNRKLVTETSEAPSPAKRSKAGKVVKKRTKKSSLQLVDEGVDEGVPDKEPLEPESGKFQPLPEVQGKGKEKVRVEQAAQVLLNLQTPKKKSPADQYIFQRRTSTQTEPTGDDESSSLYAELGLTDSETDSDEEVPGIVARVQDEGQAGPNPGEHDEGQARPNLGDAENLKLPTKGEVRLEESTSSARTLSSLQNLDKELSFVDQFLVEKLQEDEPEKTNTESEVQSMVTVPIHQDTSSVPLMTTPVIDLQESLKDFPEADMKEILHHRMWESNSYQAYEDHKMLRRKKKKETCFTENTTWVSSSSATSSSLTSKFIWNSRSFWSFWIVSIASSPLPLSTYQSDQSTSTAAPSSSKITASAEYTAWMTTNTRLKPSVLSILEELYMDDDTNLDEHVQSFGDEDIGHDHIPTVNLRQNWWKPLTEDRPATPEPAWSIPSSDLPVPVNN
ncbi:hypothetical protein Tco_0237870 [Tanacetum coccineum]